MGKGINYNPERKKKLLLEALEKSMGNISIACKTSGIPRDRYYHYYQTDLEFRKNCDALVEVILDFVESKLMQKIKEGDLKAITYFLNAKGKKRGYGTFDLDPLNKQPQQIEIIEIKSKSDIKKDSDN